MLDFSQSEGVSWLEGAEKMHGRGYFFSFFVAIATSTDTQSNIHHIIDFCWQTLIGARRPPLQQLSALASHARLVEREEAQRHHHTTTALHPPPLSSTAGFIRHPQPQVILSKVAKSAILRNSASLDMKMLSRSLILLSAVS